MTEHELLMNLINYVAELKERYDVEEQLMFWHNIVGMSDEQIKEYDVIIKR